jgi:hypothetical protein
MATNNSTTITHTIAISTLLMFEVGERVHVGLRDERVAPEQVGAPGLELEFYALPTHAGLHD